MANEQIANYLISTFKRLRVTLAYEYLNGITKALYMGARSQDSLKVRNWNNIPVGNLAINSSKNMELRHKIWHNTIIRHYVNRCIMAPSP